MKKKGAVLSVIFLVIGIGIGIVGVKYITEWNEPEASYVEASVPKLNRIRGDIAKLKSELKEKGQYRCCIKNDCNWCALYMGHCPCEDLVKKEGNEKSCPECAAAWNRKQGKIPGVDPDAIEAITFGIYGYEKGGHHHPDYKGSDKGDVIHDHGGHDEEKEPQNKTKKEDEGIGHDDHGGPGHHH